MFMPPVLLQPGARDSARLRTAVPDRRLPLPAAGRIAADTRFANLARICSTATTTKWRRVRSNGAEQLLHRRRQRLRRFVAWAATRAQNACAIHSTTEPISLNRRSWHQRQVARRRPSDMEQANAIAAGVQHARRPRNRWSARNPLQLVRSTTPAHAPRSRRTKAAIRVRRHNARQSCAVESPTLLSTPGSTGSPPSAAPTSATSTATWRHCAKRQTPLRPLATGCRDRHRDAA